MTTDFARAREEEFLRQCRARRPRPPTLIDHALRGCIVLTLVLLSVRAVSAVTAPLMSILDAPAQTYQAQVHPYRG